MITPGELSKISGWEGVRPQQIEKDYVISWLLWGVSKNKFLKAHLIFKGGTCIKKIHIENYRYSEDLDFTLKDDSISNDNIYAEFDDLFSLINLKTRMNLSIDENSKEIHTDSGSIKFYIDYVGPLGGNGDHIKMDITRGEKLEYKPVNGKVFHNYSDLQEEDEFVIQSYCLEEIVIEKMIALMGRTLPRDLYDFDYLTTIEQIDLQDVYYAFERKAEHKGYKPGSFVEKVSDKESTLKKAWENNMQFQIKQLPKFKDVWRSVGKQFRKISKIMDD